MKTQILKRVMPFVAFMVAIVFAFATGNEVSEQMNAPVTGYIENLDTCKPVPKDCALFGDQICTYMSKTVHRNSDCSGLLFEWDR